MSEISFGAIDSSLLGVLYRVGLKRKWSERDLQQVIEKLHAIRIVGSEDMLVMLRACCINEKLKAKGLRAFSKSTLHELTINLTFCPVVIPDDDSMLLATSVFSPNPDILMEVPLFSQAPSMRHPMTPAAAQDEEEKEEEEEEVVVVVEKVEAPPLPRELSPPPSPPSPSLCQEVGPAILDSTMGPERPPVPVTSIRLPSFRGPITCELSLREMVELETSRLGGALREPSDLIDMPILSGAAQFRIIEVPLCWLYFYQSTVAGSFTDGRGLQQTVDQLRSGEETPYTLPLMHALVVHGMFYGMGTRRLLCFHHVWGAHNPLKKIPVLFCGCACYGVPQNPEGLTMKVIGYLKLDDKYHNTVQRKQQREGERASKHALKSRYETGKLAVKGKERNDYYPNPEQVTNPGDSSIL